MRINFQNCPSSSPSNSLQQPHSTPPNWNHHYRAIYHQEVIQQTDRAPVLVPVPVSQEDPIPVLQQFGTLAGGEAKGYPEGLVLVSHLEGSLEKVMCVAESPGFSPLPRVEQGASLYPEGHRHQNLTACFIQGAALKANHAGQGAGGARQGILPRKPAWGQRKKGENVLPQRRQTRQDAQASWAGRTKHPPAPRVKPSSLASAAVSPTPSCQPLHSTSPTPFHVLY